MPSTQVTEPAAVPARQHGRSPGGGPGPGVTRERRPWRQALGPLILIVPMLASLLAVSLYPVLRTIWLAFRNTSLETQGDKFTGTANIDRKSVV